MNKGGEIGKKEEEENKTRKKKKVGKGKRERGYIKAGLIKGKGEK